MSLKLFAGGETETLEPISTDETQHARELLDAYVCQVKENQGLFTNQVVPSDYETGRNILAASPRQQVAITFAALSQLAKYSYVDYQRDLAFRALLCRILRRNLPWDTQSLVKMLAVAENTPRWELPLGPILSAVDRHVKKHGLSATLRKKLEVLHGSYHANADYTEDRKIGKRLKAILDGPHSPAAPRPFELNNGEAWTNALLVELGHLDDAARDNWHTFLDHCKTAKSSKPTAKWLKQAGILLEKIDEEEFSAVLRGTLAAIGQPGSSQQLNHGGWTHFTEPTQIHSTHAELLRGLVWSTCLFDHEALTNAVADAAEMCFQKIPNVGPRSPKVGNACLQALSSMSNLNAVAQLGRLKTRARHTSTRTQIARALERAAEKIGMTDADLQEIAVPTFGLTEVGRYAAAIGEFTAEMSVAPAGNAELTWLKADGKRQRSVPAAVKTDHAEDLKDVKKKAKDINTLMPSLRHRVEQLIVNERSWPLADFRQRFLDHPLVGVVARRLIWNFQSQGQSAAASWQNNAFVNAHDKSIDWLDEETTVKIWHPLETNAAEVLRWREWLEGKEVIQPFKQAHREVYVLTDAERETHTYSNRFAAHIIRQHQLAALCQQRGWQYRLQGAWDSSNAPYIELPQHELRVEFWVEPIENDNLRTEACVFLYVTTDQVRFSRLDSGLPVPLDAIPPRVFSEVMRDVDLFIGVASVGNDPTWVDGGTEGIYHDYWHEYAFGDLSQTARTRKDVLQRVIPRLNIAGQCSFDNKYLIVAGRLRTYKIHLGSGNVLMLPNDQCLCVVPKRGAGTRRTDNLYLPFEGDELLSVILSKAFLLAEDDQIQDASIAQQIGKSPASPT